MTLVPQREVPASLRTRLVLINGLIFGAPIVMLFGMYGARLAGFDILAKGDPNDAVDPLLYLSFAIAGLVICIPWFVLRLRKSLHLARYGVEVVGKVTSISSLRKNGQAPLRYGYAFGNKSYAGALDVTEEDVKAYRQNPEIHLIVDPARPERSMLAVEILGKAQQAVAKPQTTV
jgi:hypothetical protein